MTRFIRSISLRARLNLSLSFVRKSRHSQSSAAYMHRAAAARTHSFRHTVARRRAPAYSQRPAAAERAIKEESLKLPVQASWLSCASARTLKAAASLVQTGRWPGFAMRRLGPLNCSVPRRLNSGRLTRLTLSVDPENARCLIYKSVGLPATPPRQRVCIHT